MENRYVHKSAHFHGSRAASRSRIGTVSYRNQPQAGCQPTSFPGSCLGTYCLEAPPPVVGWEAEPPTSLFPGRAWEQERRSCEISFPGSCLETYGLEALPPVPGSEPEPPTSLFPGRAWEQEHCRAISRTRTPIVRSANRDSEVRR